MSEGPPGSSAPQEQIPNITDDQCREAMRSEDFEMVRTWYAQQEKIAEQDPTSGGHLELTIKMATLQLQAGFREYSEETLNAAYEDAYQQGKDEDATRIAAIRDQLFKGI